MDLIQASCDIHCDIDTQAPSCIRFQVGFLGLARSENKQFCRVYGYQLFPVSSSRVPKWTFAHHLSRRGSRIVASGRIDPRPEAKCYQRRIRDGAASEPRSCLVNPQCRNLREHPIEAEEERQRRRQIGTKSLSFRTIDYCRQTHSIYRVGSVFARESSFKARYIGES